MTCEQFPPKPLILNNSVKAFLSVIVDYIPPDQMSNNSGSDTGIDRTLCICSCLCESAVAFAYVPGHAVGCGELLALILAECQS